LSIENLLRVMIDQGLQPKDVSPNRLSAFRLRRRQIAIIRASDHR
jgi:hypothetical protein